MTVHVLKFTGRFQIWSYSVSHAQLLIRSPRSAIRATQIDVLFSNAMEISLPTMFDDLDLRQDDVPKDSRGMQVGASKWNGKTKYRLSGRDWSGYVVAESVAWDESDREFHTPSALFGKQK